MKKSSLILPRGAEPQHECWICQEVFWSADEMTRHVARCVKRNEDVLQAAAQANRERDPLHKATDWEAVEWQIKRYGDRAGEPGIF